MSMSTPINQIRNMSAGGNSGSSMPPGMLPPELMPQVQSTPINHNLMAPVYNPNVDLSSNQLVDDILNEMDRQTVPGAQHAMDTNVGNINYAMDPTAHIPPQHDPNIQQMLQSGGENTKVPSLAAFTNLDLDTHGMNLGSESMSTKILREVKPVLIVFILVFLLSLHQTNRALFGFFPSLILENGELSIYAILLRAGIACVLFYVANKFIPV